jgi:CRP/FNR family transcriptional regulator
VPGRAAVARVLDVAKLAEPCRNCVVRGGCHAARLLAVTPDNPGVSRPQPHRFARGEHVFFEGDMVKSVYFIRSGAVKSYVTSRAGDEYVAEFHLPGEPLSLDALFGTGMQRISAVALEGTEACAVPAEYFQSFARHTPDGLRWIFGLAGKKVLRSQHKKVLLNRMKADTRLGAFLLDLSGRYHERGCSACEFTLSMSRQDIANYLGMALETVSRQLGRFQRNGLLDISHQRRITILDPDGLAAR